MIIPCGLARGESVTLCTRGDSSILPGSFFTVIKGTILGESTDIVRERNLRAVGVEVTVVLSFSSNFGGMGRGN